MKTKINRKIFHIYFFAILGFLLILYYIWFRFIRERIFRDIPLMFNIFSITCVCIICAIYMYIIFRIFVPRKSPGILEVFYPLMRKLYKPFFIVDILIRRSNIFKNFFISLYYNFIVYFKLYNDKHNEYIYILFNIIPKTILLLVFITDIFYFSKLHYFYFVLWLTLLPLFYTYSVYLLTRYLNDISNYLDKHYGVVILSTEKDEEEYAKHHDDMCFFVFLSTLKNKTNEDGLLDSKLFIEFQGFNLSEECQLYRYTSIETWFAREVYIKKHKIPRPALWVFEPESDDISKALIGKFRELMPQAYYLQAFIYTHNEFVKLRTKFIKYNTYILIITLICWIYILNVSIHTLDYSYIFYLLNLTREHITEPFTDLTMSYIMSVNIRNGKQKLKNYNLVTNSGKNTKALQETLELLQKKIHENKNK